MGKKKEIISDMHLYKNKIESLIKVIIWIISWIGGILVLLKADNKEVLGSAYFIYMLSLLMEFVPKINSKVQFYSRLLHTVLCFMMTCVFLLSACIVYGVKLHNYWYVVMFILTISIIIYMIGDSFILWLEPKPSYIENNDDLERTESAQEKKFNDRLLKGNLGNITKDS